MRTRRLRASLTGCVLLILLVGLGPTGHAQRKLPDALTLGLVSENPLRRIEQHTDFIDYVVQKLFPNSAVRAKVVVTRTPLQLAKLIKQKEVDLYFESPYPTFLINELTGARVLLRRWRGGVGEYRSIIFTKRDSGITRLEDLLGKMIAFEDPGSTSAYFLPKVFLVSRGFKLTEKFSFEGKVSPKEIGYIFTFAEENIVNWVLLQKVAAGAFSSNDLNELDERRKGQLLILGETETVPRHLVSVRKDLDRLLVHRLTALLLSMHLDEEGRRVLQKADRTAKFDPLPGGEVAMYAHIRSLFGLLQGK